MPTAPRPQHSSYSSRQKVRYRARVRKRQLAVDQYMSRLVLGDSSVEKPSKLPDGTDKSNRRSYCHVCKRQIPNGSQSWDVHLKGKQHRAYELVDAARKLVRSEAENDSCSIRVTVKNATRKSDGDIEASFAKSSPDSVTFVLKNVGEETATVRNAGLLQRLNLQLENVGGRQIKPGKELEVKLTVTGRQVGCYATVVVFLINIGSSKEPVHVARNVTVHIEDGDSVLKELRATVLYKKPPRVSGKETAAKVVEGLPLKKKAGDDLLEKEIEVKQYAVPSGLRRALNHGLRSSSDSDSKESAECQKHRLLLESKLDSSNHCKKFSTLLHTEECQMLVDIRKYDLESVKLGACRENRQLLTLDVPGLVENRPSVLRGDHLYVSCVSDSGKEDRCEYKGYVHDVHATQVWLGFSERLMNRWVDNLKINCRFVFNRLPLRLQHRSVELAAENTLEKFLFPTGDTLCKEADAIVPLDKLDDEMIFLNRQIAKNKEQSLAVKQIVAGTSRPAPFLVFGPPGTGKTVTIVEAMKQVLKFVPSAHILACAPSNSAADLLAVRLLEHIPKDKLLRLCAACRDWNSVPEEIRPWCNHSSGRFEFPKKKKVPTATLR